MSNCNSCASCGSCGGGCGGERSLSLTQPEVDMLLSFAQTPFLPVARKASEETPIYLEEGDPILYSAVIICLEKKGLIDIDYHQPLSGFDYSAYAAYGLKGSMALTARGQDVLDTIDLQGVQTD